MRTTEQITNLRKVFSRIYGPIVIFLPDETIDLIAEIFQSQVNANSEWTWEIRVITNNDFVDSLVDVEPEPKSPCCTAAAIKKKCEELLKKYPSIVKIMVMAKENRNLIFQFPS